MTFTVIWTPAATAELTEIWLNADSATRRSITAAVNQTDTLLRRAPHQIGESREAHNLRVLIAAPLVLEFYISNDDHRVDITKLWQFRDRNQN